MRSFGVSRATIYRALEPDCLPVPFDSVVQL